MLDAGCGSLVSTAAMHIGSGRPTILCDLSEGMLCAARDRLIAIAGAVPDHLTLLQADIRDLPFRDGAFGSVLCPGMLHLFDDVEWVTGALARVASSDARIFMSSLVAERWIGRAYLGLLRWSGEIASPRRSGALLDRLNAPGSGLQAPVEARLEGSMCFITAQKALHHRRTP